MIERRRFMAASAVPFLGTGCATGDDPAARERIVELRTGRVLSRADMLDAIRASHYALLGELHDNPHHHAARGELLRRLSAPAVVVAEHLPRGSRVVFGSDLAASLSAAGFEARSWKWPLHAALFEGVAAARLPLTGGNVPRELMRQIARGGEAAMPSELAAVTAGAPLGAAAQAALEADLVRGHCGQLAGPRLAGMVWAQRARDASIWLALREASGSPAILLAGNGHVGLDYGVGQLIANQQPAARLVSVGFVETGAVAQGAPYTHLWITLPVERKDPCEGFALPGR